MERLVAKLVSRGAKQFLPLLTDIVRLGTREFDASLTKQVANLRNAVPYVMDRGSEWIYHCDRDLERRLSTLGGSHEEVPQSSIGEIVEAIGDLEHRCARLLFSATPEVRERAARADPTEWTLDVGRHRLHFLKAEHGAGFVVDDGWYVPAGVGRAATAIPVSPRSPERVYLLVDTDDCPSLRRTGGLYLVDAKGYGWCQLTRTRSALHEVSLHEDGLTLKSSSEFLRFGAVALTACTRR